MASVKLGDAVRIPFAAALSAILFGYWLTAPVLDHLSQDQWRGAAIVGAMAFGFLWAVGRWNISILVAGFMIGLLVAGTVVALPIAHGRVASAFLGNVESFGADMMLFTTAAAIGAARRAKRLL